MQVQQKQIKSLRFSNTQISFADGLKNVTLLKKNGLCKIKKDKSKSKFRWTYSENVLYLRYVRANIRKLKSNGNLKKKSKFVKMSDMIGTKNPNQCRSHHQKKLKKFQTIENMLQQYQILDEQLKVNAEKAKNKSLELFGTIEYLQQESQLIDQEQEMPEQIHLTQIQNTSSNNSEVFLEKSQLFDVLQL